MLDASSNCPPPITTNCISGDCRPSETLPVMYINVYDQDGNLENEINDYNLAHKNYFSGEYWLDIRGCDWMDDAENIGSESEPLPLEIKARGNWTRTAFSKKPFKLKLGKKQSLLGLSKSKHFALLAHADDCKGYLRNFIGFNLGKRIGLPWTPSQQPVEVIINGDYRGLYFLTESIRVDEDRLNIQELDDNETDPDLVSGGYLVELDNYDEDEDFQIQITEKGFHPSNRGVLKITFDTPEKYSDVQRIFITEQFTRMNDLVEIASDDLWSYMDLDDCVRYYLVCEIVSDIESYGGSTYLYRDRGENQKWHFSPLWDFGQAFNGSINCFIYDNSYSGMNWIGSIAQNEKFKEKVKETWKWFLSAKYNGIYEDMENHSNLLKKAAKCDHDRWDGEPIPSPGGYGPVFDNSDILSKCESVKTRMAKKIEWLKSQFGEYEDQRYEEPLRDTTPAAPLPDFLTNDIDILKFDTYGSEDDMVILSLQGMPVKHPSKGQFYLVVSPKTTKKVKF